MVKPLNSALHQRGTAAGPRSYYLAYTCAFVLVAFGVFSSFVATGKSFVFCDVNNGGDGLVQHFNAFCYYGKWLRSIVSSLVVDHELIIPMWDMSIGYGSDVVTTLSYYVIGDPFSFLSVLVPTKYAEFAYCALIIVRLYCAGLAFSLFCRHRGYLSYATLIAALVYVFCFYSLKAAVLHPYFVLPMIWLPLLCIGIDKIFAKESCLPYIAAFALSGLSNFYFFYMLCLLVLFYSGVNYAYLFGLRCGCKHFLAAAGKVLVCSLAGAGIAAVLLLPSLAGIMSSSRLGVENAIPLLYEPVYYLRLFPSFINGGFGSYTYMGYTGLVWIACVMLFLRRKDSRRNRFLLACLVGLAFFMCVPFVGHVFNGFGYVTNRWIWALSFLVCFSLVVVLERIGAVAVEERRVLVVASAVLLGILLVSACLELRASLLAIVEVGVFLVVFLLLAAERPRCWAAPLGVLASASLMLHAFCLYSPVGDNYLENFTPAGGAYEMLVNESPGYVVKKVKDNEMYRYDSVAMNAGQVRRNSALQLGMNSIAYYFSTTNPSVSDFNRSLMLDSPLDQSYNDLDRRSVLQHLAGVKYVVVPNGREAYLPAGYDKLAYSDDNRSVYTTDNWLPIGFTCDTCISQQAFDKLSAVGREEALARAIVLDDADCSLRSLDGVDCVDSIQYAIKAKKGLTVDGLSFGVAEKNASATLTFEQVDECDLYVEMDEVSYKAVDPFRRSSNANANESDGETINLIRDSLLWKAPTSVNVTCSSGGITDSVNYKTPGDNYYCGRDSFIVNLGCTKKKRKAITLSFSQPGIYSFDSIKVYVLERKRTGNRVLEYGDEALQHVSVKGNTISGDIDTTGTKALCVQIPYSDAWQAYVDGRPAEVRRVDVMFLGLMLEEGKHHIELRYNTPYLHEGGLITAISIAIVVTVGLVKYLRRRKRNDGSFSERTT